jgi:hypothetical protein
VKSPTELRSVEQLDANLASLHLTIPHEQQAKLDEATRPRLDFPAELLQNVVPSLQQAGARITECNPANSV